MGGEELMEKEEEYPKEATLVGKNGLGMKTLEKMYKVPMDDFAGSLFEEKEERRRRRLQAVGTLSKAADLGFPEEEEEEEEPEEVIEELGVITPAGVKIAMPVEGVKQRMLFTAESPAGDLLVKSEEEFTAEFAGRKLLEGELPLGKFEFMMFEVDDPTYKAVLIKKYTPLIKGVSEEVEEEEFVKKPMDLEKTTVGTIGGRRLALTKKLVIDDEEGLESFKAATIKSKSPFKKKKPIKEAKP